jgi:hypothetical protein
LPQDGDDVTLIVDELKTVSTDAPADGKPKPDAPQPNPPVKESLKQFPSFLIEVKSINCCSEFSAVFFFFFFLCFAKRYNFIFLDHQQS